MAGINLIRQIDKAAAAPSGGTVEIVSEDRESPFKALSVSLDDFSPQDYARLALLIFGLILVWVTPRAVDFVTEKLMVEQRAEIQKIDEKITVAETKLGALKDLKAEEDDFVKKTAEIQKKLDLVDSVGKNRNLMVRMIDYVVNEMPSSLWLTQINVGIEGEKSVDGKIDLFGNAISMQLVSEFMKRLEGAVFFPNWQLIETENQLAIPSGNKKSKGPAESKSFAISAKVLKP